MLVGVFGCDPGGATGAAWAIFDTSLGGIDDILRGKSHAGSQTIKGEAPEQIREIALLWRSFSQACLSLKVQPNIVFENFLYAPGVNYSGDSAVISTAIIWGVEGYRMGRHDSQRGSGQMTPLYLQTAGQAKGYVTNQRLKDWDLWVVGREHERSAWQHVAFWLAKFIQYNH